MALIAASLSAGCGGSVVTGNGSSGGAGGGGAWTSGSGGTTPGGGGVQSGGSSCKETYEDVAFQIDAFGGRSFSCYSGGPLDSGVSGQPKWSTTGIVAKTSPSSVVVDSCPPDADCVPMLSTISVQANDLALSIPDGAIVSVDYIGPDMTQQVWAPCSGQLVIQSVGDWGGAHDPTGDGFLYLAAVDGSFAQPPGVPFKIALAKLACSTYGPGTVTSGYAPVGDYAFRFFSSPSYSDLIVHMGETQFLVTPKQKLHVHNLRSFQEDGTDAYWDWAYWVAP